jgi:polyphosphate kinase 2
MSDDEDKALEPLHLALVQWQTAAIARGDRTVIIFEGRDAAGKDGAIKTIIEHLSVRNTRVVALPKPSDRDKSSWFFQRYVAQLPAGGELVIFNRSWYNRGGVERVMEFSTPDQQEDFLQAVPGFETMLARDGLKLIKLWLDVSKAEQAKRLAERKDDPLKVLKASPLDEYAQSRWDAYTAARDEMLTRTDHEAAPWTCVRGDKKKKAREAIMRHLIRTLSPDAKVDGPDASVLFPFAKKALKDGRLER